jgi:hypothetical protein
MPPHREPEYREGPQAAERFERTINRVLTVSKTELTKREAAYQKSRPAKNPRRARAR